MSTYEEKPIRSRRSPTGIQRPHRVTVTLATEELAEFRAAAERAGRALAAWLGQAGHAAAKTHELPASNVLREVLDELIEVRALVRKDGVLLNQAVKRLHEANGDPGPGLDLQLRHAVGKVVESLETADDTARDVSRKLL